MPRGNKVIAKLLRLFKKSRKFDKFIAANAGIGRPAGFIFFKKIIEHLFPENFTKIKDIVRNTKIFRNGCGVLCSVPVVLHTKSCAGNLVSLFFQ